MTPSGVPAKEDKVSVVGVADRDMIYHINEKEVTKEEWTHFHQKQDDQRKHREERAKENMNNRREPENHEEEMGENHQNDGDSLQKGTVATL